MKKKIIGTVVFLALAAAFLWKLNDIFSLKQEDGILPMEVFYEQEPGSIDVMFYGSSHTYSDINPAVLWEEAGIPSYDLAGSLQPLWNTYYYMKESLKYQRPKVMVVELVRAIEDRDYIEEARTVTNTFGMKFSEEKVENLKASTAEENVADYLLGYPVYHSRYTELSRADFADYGGDPNGSASKGFYPLFVTKSFESMPDMSQVTEIGELSEKGYDPRYTPQLGSTQCPVLLDTFRQKLRDQGLDIAQWGHTDVGVVIGTHTGPGCVGVAYIEKE